MTQNRIGLAEVVGKSNNNNNNNAHGEQKGRENSTAKSKWLENGKYIVSSDENPPG